jgi:hypothetical protein
MRRYTDNLGVQVQVFRGQLVNDCIHVVFSVIPREHQYALQILGICNSEYSRTTLDREPLGTTFDLHQMMVVKESNECSSRKVQSTFVCRGGPTALRSGKKGIIKA